MTSRGVPEPLSGIYAPLPTDDHTQGPIIDNEVEEPGKERRLIGYVDEGAYAFSHGLCTAIGFVSLAAVCSLQPAERLPNVLQVVLFKAPRSKQFYGAKLTVIV